MTATVAQYGRVRVFEGKHGRGDYRVEIGGTAPTHDEILYVLHWVFLAEDRYSRPGQIGREMLRLYINRVYHQDAPIDVILDEVAGVKAMA